MGEEDRDFSRLEDFKNTKSLCQPWSMLCPITVPAMLYAVSHSAELHIKRCFVITNLLNLLLPVSNISKVGKKQ